MFFMSSFQKRGGGVVAEEQGKASVVVDACLGWEGLLDVFLDSPQQVRSKHLVKLGHLFSSNATA